VPEPLVEVVVDLTYGIVVRLCAVADGKIYGSIEGLDVGQV
jgi:hypothetical protein